MDVGDRAPACRRSGSSSTPGSASARRSSTTSSCCAGSTSSSRLGRPLVIGTSASRSSAGITGRDVTERVHGTVATCVLALERGARVFRVHDVAARRGRARGGGCYVRARWPDEPDDEDYEDDDLTDDDDDEEGPEVGVTSRSSGCRSTRITASPPPSARSASGCVLDVRFDVGEPDALITDRVEDTVDYGEVCQVIALIAQQRSYKTLERLCAVIADRLASQFGAESVTVKASKPEPPIPLPVEEVSVEVWREER